MGSGIYEVRDIGGKSMLDGGSRPQNYSVAFLSPDPVGDCHGLPQYYVSPSLVRVDYVEH